MPETVSQAVAQREASPAALIRKYSTDFATVLPSHIKPDTWVRLAQGALRKGRRIEDKQDPNFGRFELEVAASNNPGAFMAALLDAARQGLEPGTEQYYLTPRKVKGKLEILGITGYQGYVDLMYRAGAVTSVLVDVVREHDRYTFRKGIDRVPVHEHKPFARDAERGKLIGVYAYAEMITGAVSKVIELNADDMARIRAVNPASDSRYSPWTNWEAAMWLKSGARQLRKWVPTSPEFRQELARAAATAREVAAAPHMPPGADQPQGDVLEGEFLAADDAPAEDWPDVPEIPGGSDA
jgi:recombination protein RecT